MKFNIYFNVVTTTTSVEVDATTENKDKRTSITTTQRINKVEQGDIKDKLKDLIKSIPDNVTSINMYVEEDFNDQVANSLKSNY